MRAKTAPLRERMIVVGLLLAGAAGLAFSNYLPVRIVAPPDFELPATLGDYRGITQQFCQNERCLTIFDHAHLDTSDTCPTCGGKLDDVSLAENRILPDDTIIHKKFYINSLGNMMAISIVISGREQRSIHRPQQCLPAQGLSIADAQVIPVEGIPGRQQSLDVMLLSARPSFSATEGSLAGKQIAYAYWFTDGNHETPYHLERLFWMGFDRLINATVNRWAYISIETRRAPEGNEHVQHLRNFIALLYPVMTASPGSPAIQ